MGHQGASSPYPCLWCLVSVDTLRARNGVMHAPMTWSQEELVHVTNPQCQFQKRTLSIFQADLVECLADPRNHRNVNKNGKYHNSVTGDMLFPVNSLDQIVPLPLHLSLGLGHDVYQLLEQKCIRPVFFLLIGLRDRRPVLYGFRKKK